MKYFKFDRINFGLNIARSISMSKCMHTLICVLKRECKWTRFGRTIVFIDFWNIVIQVKMCYEGTRLFTKNMPFETKTNRLILSTNAVLDGWDHSWRDTCSSVEAYSRIGVVSQHILSCPGGPHRLIFSYPYPRDAMPEQGHMSIPPGKGRQIRPDTGAVWSLDELSNVEVFKPRNLSFSHRIFGQESVCNSEELHVT